MFTFLSSCKDGGSGEIESLSSGEIESLSSGEVDSLSSVVGTYKIISFEEGEGTAPEGILREYDGLLSYKYNSDMYNKVISAVEEGKLYFIINSNGKVDVESEKEVSVDGKWFNSSYFLGKEYELVVGIGRSYIYGYGGVYDWWIENKILKIEKAGSDFWFRFVVDYGGRRSDID